MNPHDAYQQSRASSWTRIDMLLALYDGAIDRLSQARTAMEQKDYQTATSLLLRVQRIVSELIGGLDARDEQLAGNLHRLYTYVLELVTRRTPEDASAAIDLLTTLREGWESVSEEARKLERQGVIPPAESTRLVQARG